MDARSFADIESRYDDLLAISAPALGADPVCSSTRWILPAAAAFAPGSEPRVFEGEHGFAVFLEHDNPKGPVLTSFDSIWGFATPMIGPDPALLVDEIASDLLPRLDYYAVSVSGINPSSDLFDALQRLNPVGYTDTADRCVADLSDGFDAWLAARSSRFRRSLRTAVRGADDGADGGGIEIEHVTPTSGPDTLATINRVLAIEARSWKTAEGSGLIGTDLGFFTRSMSQRFARTGDLRVLFARLDGQDVGYVIGGIIGDRYRGFQHSFDHAHRDRSIGKLLQFRNIESLAAEGVQTYDLGMHMSYKQSYSDRIESTITLIFARR